MMMSCKEAAEAMGSSHELSVSKRMMLWLHLLMCGPCAKYREQLRILKAAVRRYLSAQPPLSEPERWRLEDGIIARLYR